MFCTNCGKQIDEGSKFCPYCGQKVDCELEDISVKNQDEFKKENNKVIDTIAKIFLVLSCVGGGLLLIPLAWMLPITIMVFSRINNNKEIGVGLKICALLFVNVISGILLLVREE